MIDLEAILASRDISYIISSLSQSSYTIPSWHTLLNDYEPSKHKIVEDKKILQDKVRSDGTVEPSSRITIGLEKLLVKRINEFTFGIPVKRNYKNLEENEVRQKIARAIELVYKYARIDSENVKRGENYYASCELFTLWYAVESPNSFYGFESKYKLKCKTFSPMDGVSLYPLFDDMGDLIAMSVKYERDNNGVGTQYFETWTKDKHFKFKNDGGEWKELNREGGDPIKMMKIPGIYLSRKQPVYAGLTNLREEIEYALSRNSNVIAYNSAPVLKVTGKILGEEKKNESKRVFRLDEGGDVAYVSWNQSVEALKLHIDTLLKLFFMQAQMPDISFENMKSLGNVGYDARMTLLMDAHLRIGDERGSWYEFLDREVNVIKAFLKEMNVSWRDEVDNVEVEMVITPFVQNDKKGFIETLQKANGGKALMSQLDSIREFGESHDPNETLEQIQKEGAIESKSRMSNLFDDSAI